MSIETAVQNLLRFSPISQRGVKDVLWDPDGELVGMVGPALTLERNLFPQSEDEVRWFYNKNNALDREWARLNNIPQEQSSNGYLRPQWFGSDEMHVSDFLQALTGAIRDAAGEDPGEISTTFMPDPGYPYTPGRTKKLYSAKKQKWFTPEPPPYLVKVKDRDGKEHWGVNFCMLAPTVCGSSGYMAASLEDMPLLVTHCTQLATGSFGKVRAEAVETLANCGGMLFPSLAVGLIPAANFGETVLVVDPMVALGGMKPYRQRGAYTAITYSTDVWTEGASELVGNAAIVAFEQLHGSPDWIYTNHFYILGPEIKDTGFGNETAIPITSTKKLATYVKRRFKSWPADISLEKFTANSELMTGDRYAYLETKVNGIVGWECIPLALTPAQIADPVSAALAAAGFKGRVIALTDLSKEMLDAVTGVSSLPLEKKNYLVYQYAWIASREIFEYAAAAGKVTGVGMA